MHFLYRNAGYFRPGFVGIGIVVKELVTEHQGHGQKPVFTTGFALDGGVGKLQAVDEEQSQEDNILSNLSCGQNGSDPLLEADGGMCVRDEGLYGVRRRGWVEDLLQRCGAFKPEQACNLEKVSLGVDVDGSGQDQRTHFGS